jgi:SWI/SNF-related matrix-associated actin-dependent regulator of chromatin subfamily D
MTQNPDHQASLRHIAKTDDDLAVLVQAIQHHKARHNFFNSMAKDPKAFMDRWMSSQKKDLSVILAEVDRADVAGLEFAKGGDDGVWGADVVREAVRYRLAKAEAAK